MYRTARSTRFVSLSAAAFLAACGGESKVKLVTPDSLTPTVSTVSDTGTKESTGNVTTKPVVQVVSLPEAEGMYRDKQYVAASEMFATFVDQHPSNPWGYYMLGLSSWKAGNLDQAEAAFVKANELDPKHVKTLLNLTRVHLDQGRPKDALGTVTMAMKLDSTSGEVYRLMGRVRSSLNEPNEAVAAYRVALLRDPMDVWSMNNLGLIMIQQGKNEEALGPLARAVQLDSTVAVFQNNLGIALEHTGRFALATEAYKAALAVDGGYTKAKLSLGRVEGRKEDLSLPPIELVTVAGNFDREIRGVQMGGPIPKN